MKTPTQWITQPGYDKANADNAGYDLLLETGSHLLLETGSDILLEDTVVTPKPATAWAEV